MDAATTNYSLSPPDYADVVGASAHQASPQLPNKPPLSVVATRRIRKANALGSPVRRSPRLSCPLPPQPPPAVCRDARNMIDTGDDKPGSIDDVVCQPSREETPDNDYLPTDEPSTVLADRIMRAQDNPSPPPQDLAHPIYVFKKSDHLLPGASPPPSPFRPINFLERLNQLSFPPFDLSRSSQSSTIYDKPGVLELSINPPCGGVISHDSCSPGTISAPMESVPHKDLAPVNTFASTTPQRTVDNVSLWSSLHVCDPTDLNDNAGIDSPSERVTGPHGPLTTKTSSPDLEVFGLSSTHVVDHSSSPVMPFTLDHPPQDPLPFSKQQNCYECSSFTPDTKNGLPSRATETAVRCGKGNDGGVSFMESLSNEDQKGKCGVANTKRVDTNPQQRLGSLSPRSTNALDGLFLPSEASIEQTVSPTHSTRTKFVPRTPPRTPRPSVMHPDLSRSNIQRPVVALTPARANEASGKLNSPAKFSFEANDIHRTPARRVPIETALTRATPFQGRIQLPIGSDQSRSGRYLAMRAPVFTRPALDDPSRNPAKRVPITNLTASPARDHQAPSSPTWPNLRARSASMEPRPMEAIPARSRSDEPSTAISKPDSREETKEFILPVVPVHPRPSIKIPFPLISGSRSSSDRPQSIPEEHEPPDVGNTEISAPLERVIQVNATSQLRQPSANSRIPRIGTKPYARPPPKNGKSAIGAPSSAGGHRASPFRLAHNNGTSGMEAPFAKPTDGQCLVGSLKRKRGAETTTPSNSHPVMIRQVLPGILNGKYAPKTSKSSVQVLALPGSSPPKALQALKFRKVVDGMLSARYGSVKPNLDPVEPSEPTSPPPPSPLSDLSSSSSERPPDEKPPFSTDPPTWPRNETPHTSQTGSNTLVVEPTTPEHSSLHQNTDSSEGSGRPRRTPRARKPAQQQYVLDIFNGTSSTRPPPVRRKPQTRADGDTFMGMSATALKALTTSNTTKNQQIVAVLATEVIRKQGLRPESPTVKARSILQKQRDERDMRRKDRAQKRARLGDEGLEVSDLEGEAELGDHTSPDAPAEDVDIKDVMPRRHRRGPGDEEDYKTPERPEHLIEPLRFDGVNKGAKSIKQVKWHRGLSTAVCLDDVDPRPKSLPTEVIVRGCLAPTSKNLPLDPLGNLVDVDTRPFPELATEQIVVKRYLYDNDIEPEPIPAKMTRSKSRKKS